MLQCGTGPVEGRGRTDLDPLEVSVHHQDLVMRRGNAGDYAAVLAFHHLLDSDFVPPLSRREPLEDRARAALSAPGYGCAMALGRTGALVALSVFRPLAGAQRPIAEPVFFGVHPSWRWQGVGTAFRAWLIDELRASGYKAVRTRTWSNNHAMIALNRRHGFAVVSVVADERGPGLDSWYFEREL
jgi:GNAT superfamily N-acetyltransferase